MFQNNLLMAAASTADAAFTVDYSCRFNDDDSAVLYKTFGGSPASDKKFTFSTWIKLGNIQEGNIYSAAKDGFNFTYIQLTSTGQLRLSRQASASIAFDLKTTQLLRDPGAWYHILVAYDSTPSTPSSSDCYFYINGVKVTDFATETYPSQNVVHDYTATDYRTDVSGFNVGGGLKFDGYQSQTAYFDNQKLTATDVSEFGDNGVWRPIDITGLTYASNSFLLDYADSSDLGNDISGLNNDFTSSGLAANDQMPDTPTQNHGVLSSISTASHDTLSDGNLKLVGGSGADAHQLGTFLMESGKWYWEVTVSSDSEGTKILGISGEPFSPAGIGGFGYTSGQSQYTAHTFVGDGNKRTSGTSASYGNAMSNDDVIGVAYDADNGIIWFSINDTWQNSATIGEIQSSDGSNAAYTGLSGPVVAGVGNGGGSPTYICNFGASAYAGTQPSGYNSLSTANLAAPAIKDGTENFQTTLYTGNGSTRNIDQTANSTFQPDLVWLKNRDQTDGYKLVDAVRGVTKELSSDSNAVESTDADGVTSFDSDGFGLGTGAGGYNDDTEDFVAWQWLAGGGAGSSNEDGTINTTTTSVNTTAGISMGTYTGTGSAATIGHGLGVAPKMVIVKERANDVGNWFVYHASNTAAPETDYLLLNDTTATTDDATVWNDTAPTSTVFSIGTHDDVNGSSDTYLYYAFAEIEGFSAFGSYKGNGSADGPMIFTGHKPAYFVVKRTNLTQSWVEKDVARDLYNVATASLYPNLTHAEGSDNDLDILSTGVKLRNAGHTGSNASGSTYVYISFATNPFGGANTTPMTAR